MASKTLSKTEALALQRKLYEKLVQLGFAPAIGSSGTVPSTVSLGRTSISFPVEQPRRSYHYTDGGENWAIRFRIGSSGRRNRGKSMRAIPGMIKLIQAEAEKGRASVVRSNESQMDTAYAMFQLGWCAMRNGYTIRRTTDYHSSLQIQLKGKVWLDSPEYDEKTDLILVAVDIGNRSCQVAMAHLLVLEKKGTVLIPRD